MALALTRKIGERVVILAGGERIEVWVSEITQRGRVRVAVEANRSTVQIVRAEIETTTTKVP